MTVRLLVGDCRAMLATLPDASAHCVTTSPPYYGLRSYGTNPQVWGGDPACSHVWQDGSYKRTQPTVSANTTLGGAMPATERERGGGLVSGAYCTRCAAWRGELGSEPTPEQFVANFVAVFREVRRVLHPTGVLVLNLGDSYAGSGKCGQGGPNSSLTNKTTIAGRQGFDGRLTMPPGYKAKDLMQMPFKVAEALRQDGWYLRSVMPWIKRAAMPESVTDRPSNALEWLFLFSKAPRYFWDAEAIRVKTGNEMSWSEYDQRTAPGATWQSGGIERYAGANKHDGAHSHPNGRAFRNTDPWFLSLDAAIAGARADLARLEAMRATGGVLTDDERLPLAVDVNPQGFPGAHFATFSPNLVIPFVRAGSSSRGACPRCLAPWVRVVERKQYGSWNSHEERLTVGNRQEGGQFKGANYYANYEPPVSVGWQPACACEAGEPIPCTVLDPFAGSGTTLLVADRLGRDAVGIELSPEYARMAEARIAGDAPMLAEVETTADDYAPLGLFEGAAS